MLWVVGIMALLGWLLGLATVADRAGPVLHVFLALALFSFGYAAVRRRRASGVVKATSHSGEARSEV